MPPFCFFPSAFLKPSGWKKSDRLQNSLMDFSRSTTKPTGMDLLNIVQRGGTNDWRNLYRQMREDPSLAEEVRRLLPLVDPDCRGFAVLFEYLCGQVLSEVETARTI